MKFCSFFFFGSSFFSRKGKKRKKNSPPFLSSTKKNTGAAPPKAGCNVAANQTVPLEATEEYACLCMKDQIQGIDLPKGKPCSKACSKSITGRPGRAVSGNLDGKSPGSACVSLPIELGELNRFVNFVLVLSSSAPVVAAKKNQEKSETHSFLFSSLPLPLKNTKQRNKTKQQVRARPRGRRQVVRVYLFFNFVFLRLEKKHGGRRS